MLTTHDSAGTVTIVACIGPNPAPLTELIWALARQRALTTTAVHVVANARAEAFLQREVLAPGAALDQLVDALHIAPPAVTLHRVESEGTGRPVPDDAHPADGDLWRSKLWTAARLALQDAGEGAAVFALVAGRRRTMTAMETVIAQLLARPQDLVVDVRVGERAAEGGSGFFFPEQLQQLIEGPEGAFEARAV